MLRKKEKDKKKIKDRVGMTYHLKRNKTHENLRLATD